MDLEAGIPKNYVAKCVVQGIIETQHVEALEILLCGVDKERLRIHEICLKSGPNLGPVASEVRLLCDLEQAEPSWTVRHIGGAMRGAGAEQISVLVRTMVESKASKNVRKSFVFGREVPPEKEVAN
ncbi:hypothetical protein K1719_016955 [Acacia pycnantha]|nr:hypothetical protein K1719_016955 [Acacia pycnantha]